MSSTVHLVVPSGIDDPHRPSGGNTYDRRIAGELSRRGRLVIEHRIDGTASLAAAMAAIPDDASVLIDGLVGSGHPELLGPAARRLRLLLLMHQPQDSIAEREVSHAADAVVVTSNWTRQWLLAHYGLPSERIVVAEPGVDPAPLAIGTAAGARLLCVGVVAAHKGQDVLVSALAPLADLPWQCVCVGSLDRDVGFVDRLRRQLRLSGLADRVLLVGPRRGDELAARYAAADLLVLPSWAETYGLVVTEALARGVPVIASDVGGVPEAIGTTPDGHRPASLVPAGDPAALSTALRRWLTEPGIRAELRRAARLRRASLPRWTQPAERLYALLGARTSAAVAGVTVTDEPTGAADRIHRGQTSRR